MKHLIFIFSLAFAIFNAFSQDSLYIKERILGTFHTTNTRINGVSFGFISTLSDKRNVKTNGIRLEVPGIGLLSFIGNGFPRVNTPFDLTDYEYSEVINWLNISTGSWCNCNYNGLTIGLVGQYGKLSNGFSLAGGWNFIDYQNGFQLSLISNSSYYLHGVQISAINNANEGVGLQIGIYNNSENFKGVQIGLWNVNQKRQTPLINWNFEWNHRNKNSILNWL